MNGILNPMKIKLFEKLLYRIQSDYSLSDFEIYKYYNSIEKYKLK